MTSNLHLDIIARLNGRKSVQSTLRHITKCQSGMCHKCGDLCPKKAARWSDKHRRTIEEALTSVQSRPIWRVTFVRDLWVKERGSLNESNIGAVKKTIRRSLDALKQPATIAIGYVDAWYAWKQWEIGASLLVSGPNQTELWHAFRFQSLTILEVELPLAVVRDLQLAYQAKRSIAFCHEGKPPTNRRGEYYAWLASIAPRSRLIRYGIDRHFNSLNKVVRPIRERIPKKRAYPAHLVPYMFGNHPSNCPCEACGGLGKHRRY